MDTGMPLVEIAAGVTAVVAVVWWMASLMMKPRAERRPRAVHAHIPRQPWDDDKPGGRGNR